MRLHRLRLIAFGSFPGEEEVDFDALGEAGLFLVHGPTGAGKTTLLDAVCYALYGRVPGQRDSARSLRCDHAPAGRGPAVTLEATIRNRRFRITRSPAWMRPKLRGSGFVEEKAKALVEELDGVSGAWTPRSTRSDEAGHLVGELLGMNADQFWQVAMLPQGDFARFLRADGDDRRKLLERLFSVKVYTEVEKWLAEHRTRTGREQQELRQEVDSVVNRMRGAAGPLLTETPPAPGEDPSAVAALLPAQTPPEPEEDPLGWSTAVLAAATGAVERERQGQALAAAALASARGRLDDGRALAERRRRHASALARREELALAADERADLETMLDEAARADRVLPLIRQASQRVEAATKARRLAADAVARALPFTVPGAGAGPATPADVPPGLPSDGTWPDVAGLRERERERRDEAARLEQLLPEETRLRESRAQLVRADARLAELAGLRDGLRERLAVLPGELALAEERLAEARLAAARLTGLRAARDAAERDLAAVRRRDALEAELADAARARTDALAALPDTPELRPVRLTPRDGAGDAAEAERALRDELATLERARRDELARLELLAGEEERLAGVATRLSKVRADIEEAAEREAAALADLASLPSALAEADGRLALARAAVARIPALESAVGAARDLCDAASQRDTLAAELEAAEGERRAAVDLSQEARDRLHTVRTARIEGMAAELARSLVPGEPCAVCGSAEHPAPAAPSASAPTADDEQAAQDAFDSARQVREAAESRVAALTSLLDEVARQAHGLSVEEARARVIAADAELAGARDTAAGERDAADETERLAAESEALRERADEAARELAGHRRGEAELLAERDRLAARVSEARGADGSVRARRDSVAAEALALAAAAGAVARATEVRLAYEKVRAEVAETRTRLSGAAPVAGGPADPAFLRAAGADACDEEPGEEAVAAVLAEAERALLEASEAAAGGTAIQEETERLAAELAEAGERSRSLDLEAAETRTRRGQLAEQVARLAALLDEARGGDPSLEARLERLAAEAALLHDAAEAVGASATAEREREAARAEASSAAAEAGFATLDDARAAARGPAEREEMAERLRRFADEQAAVEALLADPELVAAAAEPEPDLAALEEEHERAEREAAGRTSARDHAGSRLEQLTGLAAELEDAHGRYGPAAERHRLARKLAELAGGTSSDNPLHIRLSAYVLGERLRQVVAAANDRLDRMSGGRYLLQHNLKQAAGDRGRSGGGLGLRVLDGWTGVDRDPATLSGGESFITSLALALGLADVVTQEAGGPEIGTLFVDEGFGTLDEDTLDDVLDILDGLREGGRAVGIVSHVAELRTRVPAQIRVRKGRGGSTLAMV
ncbi:AAA family ATPase [Microtetraspora niveoalba]|uniref:AAA family ATPase n=1 Tax=Microtetraspora niveoalba TaxID=46175 RepID=UPI0008359106|nr:AAA family ATPase [Microtetraspora niveoalba]